MAQKRASRPPHFTPVRRMGYPDGVRCFCGATLTFAPHEPSQERKRRAFIEAHADCVYAGAPPEPSPDRQLAWAYSERAKALAGRRERLSS